LTGQHILPVTLSELAELEFLDFSQAFIPFIPDNFRCLLQVLLRKIDALKFIQQTYVSQRAIWGA
jgi:hypothetical protein